LLAKLHLETSFIVVEMDAHSAPTVIRTSTITMIVREFSDGTVDQMIEGIAAVDGEAVAQPVAESSYRPTVGAERSALDDTLDGNIQLELLTSARAMIEENARLTEQNTKMSLAIATFLSLNNALLTDLQEGAVDSNAASGSRSVKGKGGGKNQAKGSSPY